jgi:hypothetical protein
MLPKAWIAENTASTRLGEYGSPPLEGVSWRPAGMPQRLLPTLVSNFQVATVVENGEGFVQQARILGFEVPPEKIEEVERTYRTSLLAMTEEHEGFGALLLLWNPDTGEALEITVWGDEEARRSSEAESGPVPKKLDALSDVLGETPAFQSYELRIMS